MLLMGGMQIHYTKIWNFGLSILAIFVSIVAIMVSEIEGTLGALTDVRPGKVV